MRHLLLASSLLAFLVTSLGCPPDGDGTAEGEGDVAEGEGEGETAAFTLVDTTEIDADLLAIPGFAITARSDGRFAVVWFEAISDTVECEQTGGGTFPGDVHRLMMGDEQVDGTVLTRVVDPFVPNVREDAVDVAITDDDRVVVAYQGGAVTPLFCGGTDLMLAVENGDSFDTRAIATDSDTGAACRGDAGGDPYCGQGDVVGIFPSITISGDDVAVAYMDLHFGFGDDDINQSDLEVVHGSLTGSTPSSVNTESGGGLHNGTSITDDGLVLIGHNVTANNQFVDGNGDEFVVEDGIYAELVDVASGALVKSSVLRPGTFTTSRVATGAFPGKGLFVAAHNSNTDQLLMFHSVDNGTTWTPSAVEDIGRSGRDPSLVFLDDGRLVFVYGHCRDDKDSDSCNPREDGVRLSLLKDDGRFTRKTLKGDTEDFEGSRVDAARSGAAEIVVASLNSTQNRVTVNRVKVN